MEQFRAAQQGEPQATSIIPRIRLNEEDVIQTDKESEVSSDESDNQRSNRVEALNKPHEHQSTQLPSPTPTEGSSLQPASLGLRGKQEPSSDDQSHHLGPLLPVQYENEPDPGASQGNRAPKARDITANINPNLIIEGKRTRNAR